jgi:hypothetical protein
MSTEERGVDIDLSEYTALRAEIAQRSTSQSQIIAASLTVAGLGLTAGLVPGGWAAAALVIPILCAVLGLMWGDHAVQIEKAGAYIEHHLGPHLRSAANDPELMMWERVAKVDLPSSPRLLSRLGVPVLAAILAPSVPAIAIAWPAIDSVGEVLLLSVGVLMELLFAAHWYKVIRPLYSPAPRRELGRTMRSRAREEVGERADDHAGTPESAAS